MRHVLSLLFVLLFSVPAMADEYVWAPEDCEFQITLPEEPYKTRRCHDQLQDKCDLMDSYTQVFGLDGTVNFYFTCQPAAEDYRKNFTPDLMRTSLLARPNVRQMEVYDITYSDTEDAFMGALFGAGTTPNGNDQMVYVAQIWVGKTSIMSFEGEIIGPQLQETDELFAKVMSGMRPKNWTPEKAEAAKAQAEATKAELKNAEKANDSGTATKAE